jgi:hypothetical protein
MKIHSVNTLRPNGYVFVIVAILRFAQKYPLYEYVSFLIAARKQKGCKSKE